jgi:hypothetical protein
MPPGWKNNPHWRVYHDMRCAHSAQRVSLRAQWQELNTQRQALNEAADVILSEVAADMKLKTKH